MQAAPGFHFGQKDAQNGRAPRAVWTRHLDVVVKAPRSTHGGVNRFQAVGGGYDRDLSARFQAVQKHEQLR